MLQRVVFGTLMIGALLGLVALDGWLSARGLEAARGLLVTPEAARLQVACGLPFTLLVVTLVVLGIYELGQVCGLGGIRPLRHWAAFVGALLAFAPWMEMQRQLQWGSLAGPVAWSPSGDVPLPVFLVTGGVLGAGLLLLLRRSTAGALGSMAATVLMMLYLGLLGSFAVRLRCAWPGPAGTAAVTLFILTVKSTDIGAYFVGKFFGKRKLAPSLSPGKTVEGTLGGVLVAIGVAMGGLVAWSRLGAYLGPAPLGMPQAIVFAVVMAVGGQLGDLVESAFKRDVGLKDSGQVVPGFGGLLDVLDSLLLTAPVAWWMLTRGAPVG